MTFAAVASEWVCLERLVVQPPVDIARAFGNLCVVKSSDLSRKNQLSQKSGGGVVPLTNHKPELVVRGSTIVVKSGRRLSQ